MSELQTLISCADQDGSDCDKLVSGDGISNDINATVDLHVVIPSETRTRSMTISSFVVDTSFGVFNFTDEVSGKDFAPGSSFKKSFSVTLDLSSRRRYTILSKVQASTADCRGIAYYDFVAGMQQPDSIMPSAPTEPPSPSTFTEQSSRCFVKANIECTLASDSSQACEDIAMPSVPKCTIGTAHHLRFIYTAQSCKESNTTSPAFECSDSNGGPSSSPVFISITDDMEGVSYFNGTVDPGVIFGTNVGIVLADKIRIKISSLTSDKHHEKEVVVLQTVSMSTSCAASDDDISLLTQYGSLQLTAFANEAHGLQSAMEIISQKFVIRNVGDTVATVAWANMTSNLYGTIALVRPPGMKLHQGESQSFSYETTPINLYAADDQSFHSNFEVVSDGKEGSNKCSDIVDLSFAVVGA